MKHRWHIVCLTTINKIWLIERSYHCANTSNIDLTVYRWMLSKHGRYVNCFRTLLDAKKASKQKVWVVREIQRNQSFITRAKPRGWLRTYGNDDGDFDICSSIKLAKENRHGNNQT